MRGACTTLWMGALLWMLMASSAGAQQLEGTVSDEAARPLPGATVQLLEDGSGAQRYGTTTDADGRFLLARVQPGRYQLVVRFLGFAEHRGRITLAAGETLRRSIQLFARAVPQQEVVVTGLRARDQLTPLTFSNLSAQELERQPAMKDLPVQLATLPSITYYSENGNGLGYTYLRMRGFDQRRVAVSINGIPQNDPEEHNVFWINFFDIQGAIQDVQVQRGAGSSLFGPTAIGGAINVVAVPYKPYPYARAEVGVGAFGTQRYTVEANSGLRADRYVAFGRFSRLRSDGYRDWSWTRFWRFFAGVARYGERHTWMLQAYGGPQEDGLAYIGIEKDANDDADARRFNLSSFTEDVERFHQPHVELLHDWRLGPGLDAHQAFFWIKGEGYFDFDGSFRSADFLRLPAGWRGLSSQERQQPLFLAAPDASVLFRAYLDQWQLGWLPRLTLSHASGETTIGAEARLHRSLRWGRVEEAVGLPPDRVGPDNDVRVYSVRGEKIITSIYGSHLTRPHQRLAVQADLGLTWRRYRVYDEAFFGTAFSKPYLFLNPRLGVTVNPERPLSAYVSIALANREPRMKSLYDGEEAGAGFQPQFERAPAGTLDYDAPFVEPERLLDVELGASVTKTRYRLAANVFFMDFRDEIVPSGELDQFGVPRTGNADHTRHVGLEVEGTVRLAPGLDLLANATLSRNRFIRFNEFATLPDFSVVEVERDGNPIAGFPDEVVNAELVYRTGGLTASVHVRYAGTQHVDNSGGEDPDGTPNDDLVVEPYLLLNGSVQYAFPERSALRGLRLAVDVNNVMNDKVLLYGNAGFGAPQFFPAATRHVFASLRYTVQ